MNWLRIISIILLLKVAMMAQEPHKRLIMKNGDFQVVTKWEKKGERLRYFSVERNEWEEVPNAMVDWSATDKWNGENTVKVAAADEPKLHEPDKDNDIDEDVALEVEGVKLPIGGGVFTLERTSASQPAGEAKIIELAQNGGSINAHRGKNILRSVIIPIPSGQRESVELEGVQSVVRLHSPQPVFYIKVEANTSEEPSNDDSIAMKGNKKEPTQQELLLSRFRIVRMTVKNGKRTVAELKVSLKGNVSQQQTFAESHAISLEKGWIKLWPEKPLEAGEYAIVEMLGAKEMNLYVWDFRVEK